MICASELSGSRLRSPSSNEYELLDSIADGGQAEIYGGVCTVSQDPVVVKVYKDSAGLFPGSGTAESEARYLKMFQNHPNVVCLRDAGPMAVDGVQDGPDIPALVMEKADRSLAAIMNKETVSPVRAIRLLGQAAVVLDDIHAAGVLHHDATPPNMLVTKLPYGERLQLCDFGVATPLHQKTGTVVLGTLTYIAPEYLLAGRVGSSVDNYAYTVMLYQAFNGGRLPFDIVSEDSTDSKDALSWVTLHATRGNDVPEFSETDAVHREIYKMVAAGLRANPAKRPSATAIGQHNELVRAYARGMAAMPRVFA